MSDSLEKRALQWASGGDSGISSRAIFAVMTGNKPEDSYCHPHDGDDFGRCHRLLTLIPEWRARLKEMGRISAEWAALAKHWSELEKLYDEKDGGPIYKRMRVILDPIEAKRNNLIKLGEGMSIRFGRD